MGLGKTIPGTNVLADVATKHPIVHFAFEFIRDGLAQFDGKVGNTFAAVYQVTFG